MSDPIPVQPNRLYRLTAQTRLAESRQFFTVMQHDELEQDIGFVGTERSYGLWSWGAQSLLIMGQIHGLTDFEDTGLHESAFLDQNAKIPGPILEDQAIFFRVPEGVVILLGCGHAGLVSTMQHVCRLLGESEIHAVMGGTRLVGASSHRLQETVAALRRFGDTRVGRPAPSLRGCGCPDCLLWSSANGSSRKEATPDHYRSSLSVRSGRHAATANRKMRPTAVSYRPAD